MVITSAGVLQTLEIFTPRFAVNAEPGGFDAVKSTPVRLDQDSHTRALSRLGCDRPPGPDRVCADQMPFPLLGFERH
jgi:hypothetical protein